MTTGLVTPQPRTRSGSIRPFTSHPLPPHRDLFKLPSSFTPPLSSFRLPHRLLFSNILRLPYRTIPRSNGTPNITPSQRRLLTDLGRDNSVVVTPANKGGNLVILNTHEYRTEAYRQLDDNRFYKPLNSSLTDANYCSITTILNDMLRKRQITTAQYNFLLRPRDTIRDRRFYILPKTHKEPCNWPSPLMPPGRPIVSDINSESYFTAKLITTLLTPFPPTLPSFVKNSKEFHTRVHALQVPPGAIFVTADIESLYTTMDPELCLTLTRQYLSTILTPALTDNIIKLLSINLLSNHFSFDNTYFLQTSGVAMGKSFAPALASIYLAPFDHHVTHHPLFSPILYTRYIDDLFFIWPHSLDDLNIFQLYLNSLIPGIKLTFSHHPFSISFLDLSVFSKDCVLYTKVYFKPTDNHCLLAASSYHPHHTFKGILKSQFIRYKSLSSLYSDYHQACVINSLTRRGYKRTFMRRLSNHVWFNSPHACVKSTPIPLILSYNNNNIHLAKQIKQVLQMSNLPNVNIITAWKRNRNIRSILNSSI